MDKKIKLEELTKKIKECQKCPLYKLATQAVPGEGNEDAQIMFIGEGPGYWEDQKARPFVGQAGQFLDELIASIGLKRGEVFIGNLIKHRPPQNRDPAEEEIKSCESWLDEQIEIINPRLIVTLGRFSTAKFFPFSSISKICGKPKTEEGRIIFPLFHPAAGLRNPQIEKRLRDEFKKIPALLEEEKDTEKRVEELKLF